MRVALKRAHGIVAMKEDTVWIDSTVRLCEMTYKKCSMIESFNNLEISRPFFLSTLSFLAAGNMK